MSDPDAARKKWEVLPWRWAPPNLCRRIFMILLEETTTVARYRSSSPRKERRCGEIYRQKIFALLMFFGRAPAPTRIAPPIAELDQASVWTPSAQVITAAKSLADAEAREDPIEQMFGGHLSGQQREGVDGFTQFDGEQLG